MPWSGTGTALPEGRRGHAACPVVPNHQQSFLTTSSSSVCILNPVLSAESLHLSTDLRFHPGSSVAFPGFQQPMRSQPVRSQPMRSLHSQPSHLQGLYDQSVTSSPPSSLLVSGFRAQWLPLISGAFQVHSSRGGLSHAILLDIFLHQTFSLGRVHFLELWLRSHLVGDRGVPVPALLNVLSTQGTLTHFCMYYRIHSVQGFLPLCSLLTPQAHPHS